MATTLEKKAWNEIIRRCTMPKASVYPYYGGRGIEVRWKSFDEFLSDMGTMPMPGCTVERKDPNGHYDKNNCHWETSMNRQARNRSSTWRAPDGTAVADLCDAVGIPYSVVHQRVRKLGWKLEAALSTPARKDKRRKPPRPAGNGVVSERVEITCPHCGKTFFPKGKQINHTG
jgi:hypothetical protein